MKFLAKVKDFFDTVMSNRAFTAFISVLVISVFSLAVVISSFSARTNVKTAVIDGDVSDFSASWANQYGRNYSLRELFMSAGELSVTEPFSLRKSVSDFDAGDMLYLHSRNLVVNVYLQDEDGRDDRERLYFTAKNGDLGNLTGFDNYIFVRLPEDTEGKYIVFDIYKTKYDIGCCIDSVLLGRETLIIKNIMTSSIVQLVFGVISLVAGVCFITIGILTLKRVSGSWGGIYFGIFLLLMSFRVALNTTLAYIIIGNVAMIESSSRVLLLGAVPAFVAYVYKTYIVPHAFLLRYAAIFACCAIPILFIFDKTGLLPYTSATGVVHIIVFITGGITAAELIINQVRSKDTKTRSRRAYYVCMLLFIGCSFYDIALYYQGYTGGDDLFLTRIGMFIITISTMISLALEILSMVKLGIQAGQIGKIAFTDANTGIGNAAAFKARFEEYEAKKMNYKYIGIIQFDVNNLKVINDTKGHEAGDHLIKAAADIINRAFGPVGSCYRTGGDEFVVLFDGDYAPSVYEETIYRFERLIDKFNLDPEREFDLRIAYGVAYFQNDATPNKTLRDIHKIADERMYQKKKQLKARYARTPEEAVIR